MVEMAHKNSGLESEIKVLMSQIQALQNPPEAPVIEVKRSFREVTFEGEIQSLREHLTELQHLRTQVSEMPSSQAQPALLRLILQAAEKKEFGCITFLLSGKCIVLTSCVCLYFRGMSHALIDD
jgi:hypothetical protein